MQWQRRSFCCDGVTKSCWQWVFGGNGCSAAFGGIDLNTGDFFSWKSSPDTTPSNLSYDMSVKNAVWDSFASSMHSYLMWCSYCLFLFYCVHLCNFVFYVFFCITVCMCMWYLLPSGIINNNWLITLWLLMFKIKSFFASYCVFCLVTTSCTSWHMPSSWLIAGVELLFSDASAGLITVQHSRIVSKHKLINSHCLLRQKEANITYTYT